MKIISLRQDLFEYKFWENFPFNLLLNTCRAKLSTIGSLIWGHRASLARNSYQCTNAHP